MKELKYNKIIFNLNNISKSIFFVSIAIFIYNSFKLNYYEILFIDERILIDDIYNVWLIDDVYKNFQNIESKTLRSFLIILYEVSYGGDLRYGRLWSNFYILLSGPFSLINDTYLVTFTRILNIFLFVFSAIILSKTFINKRYHWTFLLSCLSLPGLEFLIRIPKPEILSIFLISIGLFLLKNERLNLSFLFFGLATFVKINFILFYAIIFLNVLRTSDHKLKLFFRSIFITLGALFIVNPILLIPPLKIFQTTLPNFYMQYFEWISSQGIAGQSELYSSEYFISWSRTLSSFYKVPQFLYIFLPALIFLFIIYLFFYSFKSKQHLTMVFLITSIMYLIFYFFFIDRQFEWYLTFPFLLLLISLFKNIENFIKVNSLLLSFIFIFISFGTFSNLELNFENKLFAAPNNLGYQNIDNQEDAKLLVDEVIKTIETSLKEQEEQDSYVVFWNPNLFIPRNGVTYNANFYVRESWDNDNLNKILEEADFFVSDQEFNQQNIVKLKVENFYIYQKKN